MTTPADIPPFHVSTIFQNLYHAPDLLDFSEPGPSPPPTTSASPQPATTSIFSSATSIAAAAGRRAAGIATGTASPSGPHAAAAQGPLSPDRTGQGERRPQTDQKIEVRCVEGYGNNLYIGRSDGVVEWWVCDASAGGSKHEGWSLRHQHTLFPRRPVSKIIVLPKVLRIFVLSEGTLHPLVLPNLETLPSTVLQPLRGIVSVVLDDEELDWPGEGLEDKNAEMTMVVVRRKGLRIYRMGQRLVGHKEIPLPSAPSALALTSRFLCAALSESSNYALIDLSDASLTEVLPISQIDADALDFDPNPNIVVIPGENEFLVTSFTGVGSMGVFLNGQGDPVRGTIEWPDHPLSIAIDSGYIIALLRSQVVVIHSLNDLEKPVQVIPVEPGFEAIGLSYSPYGISVRDKTRDARIAASRMLLLGEKLTGNAKPTTKGDSLPPDFPRTASAEDTPAKEEPESGSGLTPPASPQPFKRQPITPTRTSSLLQANLPAKAPFSTIIAETLLVGPNGLLAVSPTPAPLRLEKLCEDRRMDDAIAVVDEERRKGRRGEFDGDKASHQTTLRLLHLYLACHLLLETTFDKAGDYFLRGKVDPRLLVRLFPTFRGKIIGSAEEVEVNEGVRVLFNEMPSIDDIISTSISRNYSPHVSPNTSTAPETVELRHALNEQAKEMLAEVLRKTRQSRRKGGGARGIDSRKIDIVIDTTFAKLLADAGTTNELLALLAGTNDVVLSELEPFLEKRPYVLATVLRQQGKVERVLELLKGIAESEEGDPLCQDPVEEVAQQLDGVQDAELFMKYALWLVQRSPEKALSLLLAQNPKTGAKLDDAVLVGDLLKVDDDVAHRYLEHVVVIKRSPNRLLHQQLLDRLLDAAEKEVQDDGVKYHLEELDAEYRLSSDSQPFVVFLAEVAPATPIKMLRLKLILFLQGSPFYDLNSASTRLEAIPPLKTELAIVLGRQGKSKRALRLLARDIGDFVSAQAYCTQGGEIVPPKVAHIVASHVPEVVGWATLGDVGRKRRATVDAKLQEGLVLDLLSVYMQEGATTSKQAAALLNAQAVHLDVKDVLSLVPDEWPLDVVSKFIQRGLRRELHSQASWQILKSISAGQNLQTSEAYLDRVLSLPPVVSGPDASGGPSPMSLPDEGSIAEKEGGPRGIHGTGTMLSLTGSEKEVLSTGAMEEKEGGGGNGFFSPEVVSKELRDIRAHGLGEGEEGTLR